MKAHIIYTEIIDNVGVLVIGDKPRIDHKNGDVTGLSLDLRHYYDRKDGFVERKVRTDKEVIALSKVWADAQLLH